MPTGVYIHTPWTSRLGNLYPKEWGGRIDSEHLKNLYKKGWSLRRIEKKFNISRHTLKKYLVRIGVKVRTKQEQVKTRRHRLKQSLKMQKCANRGKRDEGFRQSVIEGHWSRKKIRVKTIEKIKRERAKQVFPHEWTIPEQKVFYYIKQAQIPVKAHWPTMLPGMPDFYIATAGLDIVVFVDGCYWHCCKKCNIANRPHRKNNITIRKYDRNINKQLKDMGYRVFRIWEHEDVPRIKEIIKNIKKVYLNEMLEDRY